MTSYSTAMETATWYVAFLMIVTLLCLAGAVVWPHITAMWGATRLAWMERRRR